MVGLHAHAQAFAICVRPDREDEELLYRQAAAGMLAAIDDVHHGYWQPVARSRRPGTGRAADPAGLRRPSLPPWRRQGSRWRRAWTWWRSRPARIMAMSSSRCAVTSMPITRSAIFLVDVPDGLLDTLAAVALSFIPELQRLMRARRRPGGHAGNAHAKSGMHFDFYGRVTPRVKDFSRVDICDRFRPNKTHPIIFYSDN